MCEDYVLKDAEENRQLQRDLAEKAQLQLYVGFTNIWAQKFHAASTQFQ